MAETKTQAEELVKEIVPEGKKEEDLDRLSKKSPPSHGLCRRCGENKPVNRLMLCYPCWVKTNLEEGGWREGLPHPEWCDCTLTDHGRHSDGN